MADQTSFAIPEPRSASAFTLPASSFSGSMDGRPRPLEPDLTSSGIALPAPIPGLIENLGDWQTPGIGRNPQSPETFVRPPTRNPIIDWYTSQEKPWDPIQGRAAPLPRAGDLRGGKLNHRLSGPAYSFYRESHVPSECETTGPGALPSDSGYHSRATQSVFNGSTCGDADRSGENGSISSHLAGLQVDRPTFSSESWRQVSLQTTPLPLGAENGSLICPGCQQKVRTKSELKKHKQKHEKPHHCDVPGCTRTEGFSTPNDVDRHKRSCHPEQRANGKYYRCIVQGCRKKEKKWPRADNFRQHLKRVHGLQARDDDLEAYVYKETTSPGPELAGLGSVGDDLRMDASHSDTWPVYDLRTTLQAIQEQAPRYADNIGFAGQQMDQYQDANVTHQQLHLMASNDTEDRLSQAAMQMSPANAADGSASIQLENPQSQQQEHQALEDVHDTSSEEQFNESDYLNDESANESELGDEPVPAATEVEMQISDIEAPRHNPDDLTRTVQEDGDSTSGESESEDTQESPTRPENSQTLDAVSLATVTAPNDRDRRAFDEAVNTSRAKYQAGPEPSLEGSSLVNNRHQASELIKALEHQGALADLLEELGYQKPRQSDRRTLTAHSVASVASVASDSSQVVCDEPNCGKVFPRPCELKKHKKRHEKPYGCTYPQCPKRFGSKNDWKRHENSQHCQFELWKCSEPSRVAPNESCGKACHRREQFKAHVIKDHGITDPVEIDSRLDYCRVGRDCESRFWCGFCKTIVETSGRGLKAGTERFNHIDDHYSGRIPPRMDISEWKSVDPDLPARGLISPGSDRDNFNGSSQVASPSLADPGNGLKRAALAQHSTPRKRPRIAVETLWFCCHCGNPSLTSTTTTCFMDHCDSHLKCNNCKIHVLPPEQ